MNEREAYVALNMMEKVGPVGVRALVSILGSARAIFEADRDQLTAARGIGGEFARSIVAQRGSVDWKGELDRASDRGIRIVTMIDEEYPAQLLDIHDPPLALYVRGSIEKKDKHSIAVVGTRRPTHYGREQAGNLAFQLAKAGFTVTSGLAHGIDTVAHHGAIKAKGRTLAVIGSALDCIYPPDNEELAREISEQGALISEFPFGRQPDKTTFPMRNRIVSGMSMGVLVVEAGAKSGALITASQALEQGRSVFAVPGRVDSPASRGCLHLLRDGARLVMGVDDIMEEFEFLLTAPGTGTREIPAPELSAPETQLAGMLEDGEQDVDSLIRSSGLQPAAVSSLLLGMEMKKVVRMLPGRMVELVRQ